MLNVPFVSLGFEHAAVTCQKGACNPMHLCIFSAESQRSLLAPCCSVTSHADTRLHQCDRELCVCSNSFQQKSRSTAETESCSKNLQTSMTSRGFYLLRCLNPAGPDLCRPAVSSFWTKLCSAGRDTPSHCLCKITNAEYYLCKNEAT